MNYIIAALGGMLLGVLIVFIVMKMKLTRRDIQLDNANKLLAEMKVLTSNYEMLKADKIALETKCNMMENLGNQMLEKQRSDFEAHLKLVKEELNNATEQLLKQREMQLSQTNKEQLSFIVEPLKENLANMRSAISEHTRVNAENKASIEKAIEGLINKASKIGDDANNLAKALKNDNKIQGNWGELVLETILQGAGLTKGVHYHTQETLRDANDRVLRNEETGKRMIPDVVVHFPDDKDVIIDSKVSLSAYVDYVNASDDAVKEKMSKLHLESVIKHVKELKRKDYSSYITAPRVAIKYVIMFIPNEAAMQLAFYQEPSLWRTAFEAGVFITSEQNLFALLRMIELAWSQEKQARNQKEIYEAARVLLDRVYDFVTRYDELGKQIDKLHVAYDSCHKKINDGNQNVVKAAQKLISMGCKASPNKRLPEWYDDCDSDV